MIAKIGSFEIIPGYEGSDDVVVIGLFIEKSTPEQKAAIGALVANPQLMNHKVNVEITALPNEGDTDNSKRKVSV